jgi:hypothetical protein
MAAPNPTAAKAPIPTPMRTPRPIEATLEGEPAGLSWRWGFSRWRFLRLRPAFFWLAAAAAFGAAGGGWGVVALQEKTLVGYPPPPRPIADLSHAVILRHDAAEACEAAHWAACLANLDKARAMDPDADDQPKMKALRAEAIAGILEKQEKQEKH